MRRRRRIPRPVDPGAIFKAFENAGKLQATDRGALQVTAARSFAEFTQGRDCADHWRVLADALTVAEQLAALRICGDAASVERIDAGQRVLAAVFERRRDRGSWTLRGAELQALDDAVWVHRVQLEHCSLAEYERAKRDAAERMRQARAGNAPADAIVLEGTLDAAVPPSGR